VVSNGVGWLLRPRAPEPKTSREDRADSRGGRS
jgi:hypothetical protein